MTLETYGVTVGNHNEEISGLHVLAILEAAFDEAELTPLSQLITISLY